MLTRIKTIFTTLKYAWNYSGTIASMLKHISAYPGIDDSIRLRIWLRPVIIDLSVLTSMTPNTIDDAVARTAIRIIDSDRSWDAVYSLLMLAHDNTGIGGVKIPMEDMQSKTVETFYLVADDAPVENPAVIIAAIGLIIQLIQLFKK